MFTYGFYNSLNGDRKYDATQISSIFDGIIEDGIFANYGELFAVIPGNGLHVIVKTGRAWFKHTWNLNDTWLTLAIDAPDALRSRIDSVVLEVNSSIDVRENSIKIIRGTPAASPTAPTMIHADGVDQYRLADVTVPAGASSIIASNITIKVGTGDTPFVTAPLQVANITDLFNKWQGQFDTWLNASDTEFDTWMSASDKEFQDWFNNLKLQLTNDVVTNLQNQINDRVKTADKATSSNITSGTANKWIDAALASSTFVKTADKATSTNVSSGTANKWVDAALLRTVNNDNFGAHTSSGKVVLGYTESDTWTAPNNIVSNKVTVVAVGGGGGGGGGGGVSHSSTVSGGGGGGGGSGYITISTITVTPGAKYNITIGAGGNGGAGRGYESSSPGGNGNDGGASSFAQSGSSAIVTATGGKGGKGGGATYTGMSTGGDGGDGGDGNAGGGGGGGGVISNSSYGISGYGGNGGNGGTYGGGGGGGGMHGQAASNNGGVTNVRGGKGGNGGTYGGGGGGGGSTNSSITGGNGGTYGGNGGNGLSYNNISQNGNNGSIFYNSPYIFFPPYFINVNNILIPQGGGGGGTHGYVGPGGGGGGGCGGGSLIITAYNNNNIFKGGDGIFSSGGGGGGYASNGGSFSNSVVSGYYNYKSFGGTGGGGFGGKGQSAAEFLLSTSTVESGGGGGGGGFTLDIPMFLYNVTASFYAPNICYITNRGAGGGGGKSIRTSLTDAPSQNGVAGTSGCIILFYYTAN